MSVGSLGKGGMSAAERSVVNAVAQQRSSSSSFSSQMAALEAAAARDEDSQSPQPQGSNKNSSKGKCDMKAEDDIKKEMDDTDSNQMGGGKNASNVDMKSEKAEPMDHEDGCSNSKMIKREIKDEPMSPGSAAEKGDEKGMGSDVKTVVPEPLPSTSSKDTKKKCGKLVDGEKIR